MPKELLKQLANFAAGFYDRGANWAARKASQFKLPELSSRLSRYFSKPVAFVLIESFVALSLAIYYFFLLLPMAEAPRHYDKDTHNVAFFTAHSHHPYAGDDVLKDWPDLKTRLPGLVLTGWLTDLAFKIKNERQSNSWSVGVWTYDIFASIFAAYHASWLLVLFGLLVRYRRDALLIILGVFSGLMLNLTMPAWEFFFPWDLPSMCFFTWAFLAYDDSKRILPLMCIVWLGALFKETTLCCALLILLGERWPLKKRMVSFVTTILAFGLAKKLLLLACAVPIPFFSANNFFSGLRLPRNFEVTFTNPGLNHVLIANAGALLIMMLLPWRSYREMLFKLIAVVFATGILLFGAIIEYRVWYEILPLGWMLISEAIARRFQPVHENVGESSAVQSTTIMDDRTRRVLKGCSWLGGGRLGGYLCRVVNRDEADFAKAGCDQSINLPSSEKQT